MFSLENLQITFQLEINKTFSNVSDENKMSKFVNYILVKN